MIEVTELRETLKKRNGLLEQVLEVTSRQPALIAGEETDLLLENLAQRQELIDALVELTNGLPEESRRARDPECAALDRQSHEIYAQISGQDQQNETRAQARLDEIKLNLRRLKEAKTAFNGYEKVVNDPGATYFDKRK